MSDTPQTNHLAPRRRTTQNHAPIYFIPPPRYIPPTDESTDAPEPSAEAVDEG
jgi:hypothetical protein